MSLITKLETESQIITNMALKKLIQIISISPTDLELKKTIVRPRVAFLFCYSNYKIIIKIEAQLLCFEVALFFLATNTANQPKDC